MQEKQSSTEQEITKEDAKNVEIAKSIENTVRDFHAAMKLREEMGVRVATRTTQIIRYSMVIISILATAMFFLIYVLMDNMNNITYRMTDMSGYMKEMNQKFTVVADNVKDMRQSVDSMSQYISSMPEMTESVSSMRVDIADMSANMAKMSANMNSMNRHIGLMDRNMGTMSMDMMNMSQQFTSVNNKLGLMNYDVNRMSAPMRMFPFNQ